MFLFTHPAVRVVATATLLGAFVLARPLPAASADLVQAVTAKPTSAQEILAQAAPSEATPPAAPEESPSTATKEKAAVDAKVEARIKALHAKLHIPPAQETQWNALAQVMRDTAHAMTGLPAGKAHPAKDLNPF